MEKNIDVINQNFSNVKSLKEYKQFSKEMLTFICEEASKPENEADSDFLLYCARMYVASASMDKLLSKELKKQLQDNN